MTLRYLSNVLAMTIAMSPLAANADKIGAHRIKNNAITSKHIRNGQVKSQDIRGAAIGQRHLRREVSAKFLIGSFVYVDSNGKAIGPMVDNNQALMELTPENAINPAAAGLTVGDRISVNLRRDSFDGGVLYTGPDCTGETVGSAARPPRVTQGARVGPDPSTGRMTAFVVDYNTPRATKTIKSQYSQDGETASVRCHAVDSESRLDVVVPVADLSSFVPPFRLRPVQ